MSTPGPTTSGRVLQLPWAAGERGKRGRVEFQVAMRSMRDAMGWGVSPNPTFLGFTEPKSMENHHF